MKKDGIAEVGIDAKGSLFVRPETLTFPMVYRAAMEVHWDQEAGRLFGPPPREWSYAQWFRQILAAAADEYGADLTLGPATLWSNVPREVRVEIEAGQGGAN